MIGNESHTITVDEYNEICKELNVTGAEYLNLIFSIAQIFDRSFYVKVVQKKPLLST